MQIVIELTKGYTTGWRVGFRHRWNTAETRPYQGGSGGGDYVSYNFGWFFFTRPAHVRDWYKFYCRIGKRQEWLDWNRLKESDLEEYFTNWP